MDQNLSPAKKALLEKWLKGKADNNSTVIPVRPAGSTLSISFPQRRQLFLELLNTGTAVNNLSVLLQLKGKTDISVLEQSAKKIIARHETLRTSFSFNSGVPMPVISTASVISIPVTDLQTINETEQVAKARSLAEKEVLKPFDLDKAPLIRLRLYTLSEEKYLLLVIAHHTVADGWSLGVFLKELMICYIANINGEAEQLTEFPIQYADFAHWQIAGNSELSNQPSIDYWKKQLSGELPVLELPIDKNRGNKQTFSGSTHHFIISKELTGALEKLAKENDATLFMTLLSTYNILLHRYSGQDEIITGTPVANRNHPELENLIGVFINPLALKINFKGNPGFAEMLKRVRNICLEAYAHQDLPFEKIIEELKPHRDLSRSPVFQTVFNLQSSPMPKLELPGVEISFLEVDRGVSQFDLTLMLTKSGEEYHATVEYNNELFEATTIARMFESFQLLLNDIVANPNQAVSALQIIAKEEQHHLVYELNQTQSDFPREKCFHRLFETQAEQTPDSVAVIYNNERLSYSELNQRANNLARHLQSLGVSNGTRVGILKERTSDIIVALLAVLKSGGTYVPVSISIPAERIEFILKDAEIKVLITNVDLSAGYEQEIKVINLDSYKFSENNCVNIQTDIRPGNLAYIIYTSGSTGQPKGVMVPHSALTNFLWSMRKQPGINREDVLLAVTPISFDIAALELFLPLITGGTVVIAGKEITSNPVLMAEAISKYNVSIMQATPATWQLLVDTGWKGNTSLKALCGGEALTRKLANQLLERVAELWNMYGPTETTIWSSVQQIKKGDSSITIGKPIANTQFYILDANLQPVPVGVTGELHIGGEGLAKGYLNREILTKEKFIPDCFNSNQGSRLYKTGDRTRYLPDYSMEILGRNDDQVKINGHRVELGEIAASLMEHCAVQDAVAIIRTETRGDKRIVAYYVPKHNIIPGENELQNFLREKLPSYMIPAVFVSMKCLPVTTNGKLDRKSLPVPEDIRQLSGYIAPRNRIEQILVNIWQDVLEVEHIGINDNFFDLGGASIQSLEVVAKANMSGIHVSVENIFEHQTIAGLAAQFKIE